MIFKKIPEFRDIASWFGITGYKITPYGDSIPLFNGLDGLQTKPLEHLLRITASISGL
jgi:hypothetical protein